MSTSKYIVFYCPGLYPCQTGGMEIYNYYLIKNLLEDEDIKDKMIILTGCKKLINHETIYPLYNRLFLTRKYGLGALSTLIYYIFLGKLKWRNVKTIFIPYTSNFEHSAFAFLVLKKIFNIEYVVHIHGGGLKNWKTNKLQKKFFKNAKKIAGVSNPIVKEYKKRTNRKVEFLPPLIPFKKCAKSKTYLKKEKGLEQFDKIILFVGTLKPLKAPDVLLKSILELGEEFIIKNKIGIVLVGDGPLKEELQKFTKKHKLEKQVVFTGKIPNENINEYYALADIYVIPSWFEGTPIALLEAFFNKLICIGSDVNGIKEIIVQEKNGFLFKKNDFRELASLLTKIILDTNLGQKTRNSGYAFFTKNYAYQYHTSLIKEFIGLNN